MTSSTVTEAVAVVTLSDELLRTGNFQHIVDVAGGHGALTAAVLDKTGAPAATVLDLPQTIAAAPARKGVTYKAGNMFKESLAGDLYLLKHILHDWNDEECMQILGKVLPIHCLD